MTSKQLEALWPQCIEEVRRDAADAERLRILNIEAIAEGPSCPHVLAKCLADSNCTPREARSKLVAARQQVESVGAKEQADWVSSGSFLH